MITPNYLSFLCFLLPLFSMSAQGAVEKLPLPLQALQKQGLEFKGQFDAGPNLHGYVVQYQGQGSTVFLTPDKQHAIVGNLIDSSGNNLSDPQVEKYVYAPMGKQMWSGLKVAAGLQSVMRKHRVLFTHFSIPSALTVRSSGRSLVPGWIRVMYSCASCWSVFFVRKVLPALPQL